MPSPSLCDCSCFSDATTNNGLLFLLISLSSVRTTLVMLVGSSKSQPSTLLLTPLPVDVPEQLCIHLAQHHWHLAQHQ